MDKDLILTTLLKIDDPFYLNTFNDSEDEDEWFRLNEKFIQNDLQKYFPTTVDTHDHATWVYIRSKLKQFPSEY